jgi:hypothetical protein
MAHDRADRAGSEAAGYGAFAKWAHKARGEAVDAFRRRPSPPWLGQGPGVGFCIVWWAEELFNGACHQRDYGRLHEPE